MMKIYNRAGILGDNPIVTREMKTVWSSIFFHSRIAFHLLSCVFFLWWSSVGDGKKSENCYKIFQSLIVDYLKCKVLNPFQLTFFFREFNFTKQRLELIENCCHFRNFSFSTRLIELPIKDENTSKMLSRDSRRLRLLTRADAFP